MLLFKILALACFFIHPPFLVYLLIPMFLIIFIPRGFLIFFFFGLFTFFQISLKSSYSQVSMINCEKQSSRESAADNRSPQYMEISQRFSSEQTICDKKNKCFIIKFEIHYFLSWQFVMGIFISYSNCPLIAWPCTAFDWQHISKPTQSMIYQKNKIRTNIFLDLFASAQMPLNGK